MARPAWTSYVGSAPGKVLVVACGPSAARAKDLKAKGRLGLSAIVGVADVERFGVPITHLVVRDHIDQYPEDRRRWILNTKAHTAFLMNPAKLLSSAEVVRYDVVTHPGDGIVGGRCTMHTAVSIAYLLGATTIGMLGHDLDGHRTLGNERIVQLEGMDWWREMIWMQENRAGFTLWNLSPDSLLETVPKIPLEYWLARDDQDLHRLRLEVENSRGGAHPQHPVPNQPSG